MAVCLVGLSACKSSGLDPTALCRAESPFRAPYPHTPPGARGEEARGWGRREAWFGLRLSRVGSSPLLFHVLRACSQHAESALAGFQSILKPDRHQLAEELCNGLRNCTKHNPLRDLSTRGCPSGCMTLRIPVRVDRAYSKHALSVCQDSSLEPTASCRTLSLFNPTFLLERPLGVRRLGGRGRHEAISSRCRETFVG